MVRSPVDKVDIRTVAREAGVSTATVSRVLSGRGPVSSATSARVLQAVEALGYRPNESGRALRTQQSGTVALMISSINNSFYAAIATEIEQQLTALGYVTLIGNTNEDPERQDRFFAEATSRRVSALLMLCAVDSRRLMESVGYQPCILLNRRIAGLGDLPFVGIDDYQAARELADAIVQRGATRVGVLAGPASSLTSAARRRGLLERLGEHGLEIGESDVVEARLSISSGYQAAARLLADGRRYDALFCGNDQIAYGAYRRCRELSITVPDALVVYGFDDNPLNQWLAPWLNTVRVPAELFAREVVALLKDIWAGREARDAIVPYELVLRH